MVPTNTFCLSEYPVSRVRTHYVCLSAYPISRATTHHVCMPYQSGDDTHYVCIPYQSGDDTSRLHTLYIYIYISVGQSTAP